MPTRGESRPGDEERESFARAAAALTAAYGRDDDLCGPFLVALPISGAVISTLGDPLGSETVCASSVLAARIDEIQIDLGDGPCWEAQRLRRPVLTADLQREGDDAWPGAGAALRELGIGSIHAVPLTIGSLALGSVDVYSMLAQALLPQQVTTLTALADIAARHVLRRAEQEAEGTREDMAGGRYSRREIHQASGMVSAQLDITVDDALAVLRGHAFAEGRAVRDVAVDVLARRLDFGR